MKNGKLYEIESVSRKIDFFNFIISDNKYPLYWHEILSDLEVMCEKHPTLYCNLKTRFYQAQDFVILEDMGIDYNHLDAGGNNFLHFFWGNRRDKNSHLFLFDNDCHQYIASKTNDIYHLNNYKTSILFNMLKHSECGINGHVFFSFVEQYPSFDLNQLSLEGKNLINYALLESSPPEIIDYLIEKNVSITHIDKQKQSLLHLMPLTYYNSANKRFLSHFLLHLDISQEDQWKSTCIHNWLTFYTSENVHQSKKEGYLKWLKFTLDLIKNRQFLQTMNNTIYLQVLLNKSKKNLLDVVYSQENREYANIFTQSYNEALSSLNHFILNENLNHKDKPSTYVKIKI